MAKKKEKISQGLGIAALLLNILILPGLGTLIGGRHRDGTIQLVLFIVGIPLSIVLIGIPLMFGMWVWSIVSGVQILNESK